MNPNPVRSPIPWPPAAEHGGFFKRIAHHFRWRRQAREVYESVSRQLSERPTIPCSRPPGSIEAEVSALLTEHLNADQFFGTFTYHDEDPLSLLSVHPVDDLTLVQVAMDIERKFQIRIERDLHDLSFGEAVLYVSGLIQVKRKRAEPSTDNAGCAQ